MPRSYTVNKRQKYSQVRFNFISATFMLKDLTPTDLVPEIFAEKLTSHNFLILPQCALLFSKRKLDFPLYTLSSTLSKRIIQHFASSISQKSMRQKSAKNCLRQMFQDF